MPLCWPWRPRKKSGHGRGYGILSQHGRHSQLQNATTTSVCFYVSGFSQLACFLAMREVGTEPRKIRRYMITRDNPNLAYTKQPRCCTIESGPTNTMATNRAPSAKALTNRHFRSGHTRLCCQIRSSTARLYFRRKPKFGNCNTQQTRAQRGQKKRSSTTTKTALLHTKTRR